MRMRKNKKIKRRRTPPAYVTLQPQEFLELVSEKQETGRPPAYLSVSGLGPRRAGRGSCSYGMAAAESENTALPAASRSRASTPGILLEGRHRDGRGHGPVTVTVINLPLSELQVIMIAAASYVMMVILSYDSLCHDTTE
jgi:hypothetical protein